MLYFEVKHGESVYEKDTARNRRNQSITIKINSGG